MAEYEDGDSCVCAKCHKDYSLRENCEPSEYCDRCVHDVVDDLRTQLRASEAECERLRREVENGSRALGRLAKSPGAQYADTERARAEEAERDHLNARATAADAWADNVRLEAELAAANARAGRLEGALTELVGWIKSNGRIENHGHRKPGASCVECQVVNAAEAALSTAPQAPTEPETPSPAVGEAHQPTVEEWKTRARQAESLAWKRYKTIKKLRKQLRTPPVQSAPSPAVGRSPVAWPYDTANHDALWHSHKQLVRRAAGPSAGEEKEMKMTELPTKEKLDELEERRWVQVSEQVPPRGVSVLVYRSGIGIDIGRRSGRALHSWERHSEHPLSCVTHWMPLPSPPESTNDR